jgi:ATP-dependent DNA ligase
MSFLYPMRPSVPRMLPATPDDYLVQPKYDGWNVVVHAGHIWTRHGNDITSWCLNWGFDLAPQYPVNGELLARTGDVTAERADIQGIRNGRCRPYLLAFDLMLEGPPIEQRLSLLRALAAGNLAPVPTTDPSQTGATWQEVNTWLAQARHCGKEGLILKKKGSLYSTSRETSIVTADWLKLKVPVAITC